MKRSTLSLPAPRPEKPPELLPRSALVVPVTIEEADDIVQEYIARKSRGWKSPRHQTWAKEICERWTELRGEKLPGDQLWTYKTGPTRVEEGIALERKRRIIAKAEVARRHVIEREMFRLQDRIPASNSPRRTK